MTSVLTPSEKTAAGARRFGRLLRLCGKGLLIALALAAAAFVFWQRAGLPERVTNDTARMPLAGPSQSAHVAVNAFPHLRFFEPTCVVAARDGSRRLFVLERRGTLQLIQDDPHASEKRLLLDISARVVRTPYDDDGAIGLALHPGFGQPDSPNRGYLYLFYTADVDGNCYDRLSRFTFDHHAGRIDPASERVLIDQLDENLWHNGGALAFGPDGFLYVGVGDEGTDGDGLQNGQRIDKDLFSGILRIDVDRRGGDVSHPPLRQPDTGKTAGYFIPSDNPFVGVAGALEEFWAIGLRNPHRIAFDFETGRLWCGDVGHLRREEVNLIIRGGNYQWSYGEGRLRFNDSYLKGNKPAPYYGIETPPLLAYPHVSGNNCVIGGFVYRGQQHDSLVGKYIYADNGSGRVWALQHDGEKVVANDELLALPVSSKTGIASLAADADGEVLIVVLGKADTDGGEIYRIQPAAAGAKTTFPQLLSETGLFTDTVSLTPSPGMTPYVVNSPQWSDGAAARRWMLLPGDGTDPDPANDSIQFDAEGRWTFPAGAIFVQHLEMPLGEADPSLTKRLETRVLVRDAGSGVYAVTYRWNDEQTDAELFGPGPSRPLELRTPAGDLRRQTWPAASGQSCLVCHNSAAGYVLGVRAEQLNREFVYPGSGVTRNQLAEWSRVGMFSGRLSGDRISVSRPFAALDNAAAAVNHRARSYLAANCAHCHRPGGARGNFDARFIGEIPTTALFAPPRQGAFGIDEAQIVTPGDPYRSVLYYRMSKLGQGRMPHLGSSVVHEDALRLIHDWIARLPRDASASSASQASAGDEQALAALEQLTQSTAPDQRGAALAELLASPRRALMLVRAIDDDRLDTATRAAAVEQGAQAPLATVRDVFERYLPEELRTVRLGDHPDPLSILALEGDPRRGEQLYFGEAAVHCRGCHRIGQRGGDIGPALSQIGKKYKPAELLEHILVPSEKIEPPYIAYLAETSRGRVYTGILREKTDRQVVLQDAQGKLVRIAADDLELLEPQQKSLMPDLLLRDLTPQQAADLLAYLASLRGS